MRRAARWLAIGLLIAACRKGEEAPPPAPEAPPPLPAEAIAQIRDACLAYVDQACSCAAAKPDDAALKDECALARAVPGALDLALGTAKDETSVVDAQGLRANVGKIQKNCVEGAARLATTCPAPGAPAAPATP
jgi:hypothetical protein